MGNVLAICSDIFRPLGVVRTSGPVYKMCTRENDMAILKSIVDVRIDRALVFREDIRKASRHLDEGPSRRSEQR